MYTGVICLGHVAIIIASSTSSRTFSDSLPLCTSLVGLSSPPTSGEILCLIGFQKLSYSLSYVVCDMVICFLSTVVSILIYNLNKTKAKDEKRDKEHAEKFMSIVKHSFEIAILPFLVLSAACIDNSILTFPLLLASYIQIYLWAHRKLTFGKQRLFRYLIIIVTFVHISWAYFYQVCFHYLY